MFKKLKALQKESKKIILNFTMKNGFSSLHIFKSEDVEIYIQSEKVVFHFIDGNYLFAIPEGFLSQNGSVFSFEKDGLIGRLNFCEA